MRSQVQIKKHPKTEPQSFHMKQDVRELWTESHQEEERPKAVRFPKTLNGGRVSGSDQLCQ